MKIGIDLGGTKTEIIALDEHNQILARRRVPTIRGDYPASVDNITELVSATERELQQSGSVGIGIPGAVSPDHGRIKNANSTWLIDQNLAGDLSQRLNRPIRIANDADCFVLSEAIDGAGRDDRTVFGVILGTGVGGGIVVNKQLLGGPNAICGEWGHNPLPWPNKDDEPQSDCYCGLAGCIETYLSGPGFTQRFNNEHGQRAANTQEIIELALNNHSQAIHALTQYYNHLARALASVINILDPDIIVLGGGMSNIESLYEHIPNQWGHYVFSDQVNTRLRKNQHGDSSGVRGAAWLWGDADY